MNSKVVFACLLIVGLAAAVPYSRYEDDDGDYDMEFGEPAESEEFEMSDSDEEYDMASGRTNNHRSEGKVLQIHLNKPTGVHSQRSKDLPSNPILPRTSPRYHLVPRPQHHSRITDDDQYWSSDEDYDMLSEEPVESEEFEMADSDEEYDMLTDMLARKPDPLTGRNGKPETMPKGRGPRSVRSKNPPSIMFPQRASQHYHPAAVRPHPPREYLSHIFRPRSWK